MKNVLLCLTALAIVLVTADWAQAGSSKSGKYGKSGSPSSGKGYHPHPLRVRNNSHSEPVRVWVLSDAEAGNLNENPTKGDLIGRFGNGVNLTANEHKDFAGVAGSRTIVAVQTAAFDSLPNDSTQVSIDRTSLGYTSRNVAGSAQSRRQVKIKAVNNRGRRTTTASSPSPY